VRLRVGYAPSLAAGLLSAAVENFTHNASERAWELFDLSTEEMLEGLKTTNWMSPSVSGTARNARL